MSVPPGRYRVVVAFADRDAKTGWWDEPAVAAKKSGDWIGLYGKTDVRVELYDTANETVIDAWPDDTSVDASAPGE
ncbi:hypothetical protein V2W30_41255 (plasmid) [Streptomyces sp. Q6]|uniref:Uncharacterized protein n=1 Tax=Streptomyces citrinus TaxID=3118173 RepID=A0ACD5AQX0_9ACTN